MMVRFCYKSIPLMLIDRKDYQYKNAKRFTLNGTNQNVWIPNKHLDMQGRLKPYENIDYVFRKAQHQLLLAGITWAIPGIKRKDRLSPQIQAVLRNAVKKEEEKKHGKDR